METEEPCQLNAICDPGLYAGPGNKHIDKVIKKIIVKVEDI